MMELDGYSGEEYIRDHVTSVYRTSFISVNLMTPRQDNRTNISIYKHYVAGTCLYEVELSVWLYIITLGISYSSKKTKR